MKYYTDAKFSRAAQYYADGNDLEKMFWKDKVFSTRGGIPEQRNKRGLIPTQTLSHAWMTPTLLAPLVLDGFE